MEFPAFILRTKIASNLFLGHPLSIVADNEGQAFLILFPYLDLEQASVLHIRHPAKDAFSMNGWNIILWILQVFTDSWHSITYSKLSMKRTF